VEGLRGRGGYVSELDPDQREERDREETQHGFCNFTHDGRLSTLYSSCAGFPFVGTSRGRYLKRYSGRGQQRYFKM
jgi:hypothetical protein